MLDRRNTRSRRYARTPRLRVSGHGLGSSENARGPTRRILDQPHVDDRPEDAVHPEGPHARLPSGASRAAWAGVADPRRPWGGQARQDVELAASCAAMIHGGTWRASRAITPASPASEAAGGDRCSSCSSTTRPPRSSRRSWRKTGEVKSCPGSRRGRAGPPALDRQPPSQLGHAGGTSGPRRCARRSASGGIRARGRTCAAHPMAGCPPRVPGRVLPERWPGATTSVTTAAATRPPPRRRAWDIPHPGAHGANANLRGP